MNRALILAFGLCGALALTAGAADVAQAKKRSPAKKEQKTEMKELRKKYDTDGDGKLSKEERGAISAEDKAKMKESRSSRKKAKIKA
jgi:L-serine deaminase